ncbi:MAG: replication factor C small subunit, partial [Candidatus Thorarchaeota archaeon]
ATGRATEDDVYEVSDSYLTREVREMVTHAIRGAFGKSRDSMRKLLAIEGYSPQDVLREILYDLVRRPFSPEHLRELIDRTANIDYRMSQGRNPFIHIEALLATIQRVAAQ